MSGAQLMVLLSTFWIPLAVGASISTGKAEMTHWTADAPGVRRRLTIYDLPTTASTESASNLGKISPELVAFISGALREVSDALTSRFSLAEARVEHERALGAYKETVRTWLERYRLGTSSYCEVLQERQLHFPGGKTPSCRPNSTNCWRSFNPTARWAVASRTRRSRNDH
jgi:hypothetical protein